MFYHSDSLVSTIPSGFMFYTWKSWVLCIRMNCSLLWIGINDNFIQNYHQVCHEACLEVLGSGCKIIEIHVLKRFLCMYLQYFFMSNLPCTEDEFSWFGIIGTSCSRISNFPWGYSIVIKSSKIILRLIVLINQMLFKIYFNTVVYHKT